MFRMDNGGYAQKGYFRNNIISRIMRIGNYPFIESTYSKGYNSERSKLKESKSEESPFSGLALFIFGKFLSQDRIKRLED